MARMRALNNLDQPADQGDLPYNEPQVGYQGPPLTTPPPQQFDFMDRSNTGPGPEDRHPEDKAGEVNRGSYGPRENFDNMGGAEAAPSRPRTPTPMAGSTFSPAMPPVGGVIPFTPMGDTSGVSLAKGRLFGRQGGLTGGGLGVPLDPVADESQDPISTLIKLLMGGGQKGY